MDMNLFMNGEQSKKWALKINAQQQVSVESLICKVRETPANEHMSCVMDLFNQWLLPILLTFRLTLSTAATSCFLIKTSVIQSLDAFTVPG